MKPAYTETNQYPTIERDGHTLAVTEHGYVLISVNPPSQIPRYYDTPNIAFDELGQPWLFDDEGFAEQTRLVSGDTQDYWNPADPAYLKS